jgi:hypothetical protein
MKICNIIAVPTCSVYAVDIVPLNEIRKRVIISPQLQLIEKEVDEFRGIEIVGGFFNRD